VTRPRKEVHHPFRAGPGCRQPNSSSDHGAFSSGELAEAEGVGYNGGRTGPAGTGDKPGRRNRMMGVTYDTPALSLPADRGGNARLVEPHLPPSPAPLVARPGSAHGPRRQLVAQVLAAGGRAARFS